MPRQTKPKMPMRRAHHAKILVGIGKPPPVWVHHRYVLLLPCLTIRPDQTKHTKESGQYGGRRPHRYEADRSHRTLHHSHSVMHRGHELAIQAILLRRPGGPIRPTWYRVRRPVPAPHHHARWRSGGPHPKTPPIAPTTAYDLIFVIEANNFGKEFLRMAGIAQMLHRHKPSNDT
jgi:hypothetical protein